MIFAAGQKTPKWIKQHWSSHHVQSFLHKPCSKNTSAHVWSLCPWIYLLDPLHVFPHIKALHNYSSTNSQEECESLWLTLGPCLTPQGKSADLWSGEIKAVHEAHVHFELWKTNKLESGHSYNIKELSSMCFKLKHTWVSKTSQCVTSEIRAEIRDFNIWMIFFFFPLLALFVCRLLRNKVSDMTKQIWIH